MNSSLSALTCRNPARRRYWIVFAALSAALLVSSSALPVSSVSAGQSELDDMPVPDFNILDADVNSFDLSLLNIEIEVESTWPPKDPDIDDFKTVVVEAEMSGSDETLTFSTEQRLLAYPGNHRPVRLLTPSVDTPEGCAGSIPWTTVSSRPGRKILSWIVPLDVCLGAFGEVERFRWKVLTQAVDDGVTYWDRFPDSGYSDWKVPLLTTWDRPISAVEPFRVVDTRAGGVTVDGKFSGGGMFAAGETRRIQITDRDERLGGADGGALAAGLNVVAVGPQAQGWIAVWPCGPQPLISTLNYHAGETRANSTVVGLDANGGVCVNSLVATHLVIDVISLTPAAAAAEVVEMTPVRVVDTRAGEATFDGRSAGQGPIPRQGTFRFDLSDRLLTSPGSTASINVVAVNPASAGHLTIWPCDETKPVASSLNYLPGKTVANMTFVQPGDGDVCVFSYAETHLVVDVMTEYVSDAFQVNTPDRDRDTRSGSTHNGVKEVGAGRGWEVIVTSVPPFASAVIVNVVAVHPLSAGHMTVRPCDSGELPPATTERSIEPTSTLNYGPGQTTAATAVVPLRRGNVICVTSYALASLVVDVVGYIR